MAKKHAGAYAQRLRQAVALAGLAALGGCSSAPKPSMAVQGSWLNTAQTPSQRAAELVSKMTLPEKVSQMMDQSPAIPRLGVPEYNWWSEGLHGIARSGYATLFPQAIGMAATWDTPLIGRESSVISIEARAKYNDAIAHGNHQRYFGLTIWSPNINIFRDPRWGRGQETYGEDPYLTATLGTAFVEGLQDDPGGKLPRYFRAIATPKHFAVHSGPESTRHKANVVPSPYDLESTYLPAFRATIVNGKADSLMCAYNAIDGEPACANTMLLQTTLRDAWHFQGFVTSDCGAVQDFFDGHGYSQDAAHASASAVLAGTDTNCGESYKVLVDAVHHGLLPESAIDRAANRLFTARMQLGMFDPMGSVPYNNIAMSADDSTPHRALAGIAANESMVLLKNENHILPLKSGLKTIAVVGPNAASLLALEGNYNAIPSRPVLPIDGMNAQFPGAKVLYAQGSPYVDGMDLPAPRSLFHTAGNIAGLTGHYYNNDTLSGAPRAIRIDKQIDFDWSHASPISGVSQTNFSVRWTGTIAVPKAGEYIFGAHIGYCSECADKTDRDSVQVLLDGQPVAGTPPEKGHGWDETTPQMHLKFADTDPHKITIEYTHHSVDMPSVMTLLWTPPAATLLNEAVDDAKQADVVVAFVGLTSQLEGEEMPVHVRGFSGGDRTLIDLPPVQQNLLHALAATGKPLVVVLENGSALAVNWSAAHADAILEAWYPGELGGTAIAGTLAGGNDPGGKLPVTFYTGISQLPAFDNYSMKNRTYRYFSGKPLYQFGYGLSYTHFAFGNLTLSSLSVAAGQPLTMDADVKNTGQVGGDEVAELYMTPPQNGLSPKVELIAFQRVHLSPGQTRHVQFTLSPRQMSVVDARGARSMSAGDYSLYLGGGQPDAPEKEADGLSAKFSITGQQELPR
jgi:beta-glucosidase